MRIFGVILAGGQGRRLGGADKALIPLAGRPLIAHVLDRLEPQVDRVLISANGDPSRFTGFGCRVLPDARPQGPLSGVLAALTLAVEMEATHVVSTPVDTPFLPGDLVPQLLLAAEGAPEGVALASDATGDHPATALWPVGLAPALADFLATGEARVLRFAEAHRAGRARFPDPGAFRNLNTPEDLSAAEALIRGAA
ncbi:molybdenum cofactor guanylyltransferase MobA [Rhodobacter calidifons]|uniref:Molybdenum cofactor guanylyltransferase n=1 Tax=Rhodobacter calidifons TaxID=2715277 RepID=A0ABX0GB15_9RHOB|nr:molybdenum cofactor guanylyltransferase MobA [Rhodobacter calidifons]NHB78063.1 molybdenum cofactor guanylyltransferase [Rhodobacter calidifons]